jgi:hypothetical protein
MAAQTKLNSIRKAVEAHDLQTRQFSDKDGVKKPAVADESARHVDKMNLMQQKITGV